MTLTATDLVALGAMSSDLQRIGARLHRAVSEAIDANKPITDTQYGYLSNHLSDAESTVRRFRDMLIESVERGRNTATPVVERRRYPRPVLKVGEPLRQSER